MASSRPDTAHDAAAPAQTRVDIVNNNNLAPDAQLEIKFSNLNYAVQIEAPNPDRKRPFKRTITKEKSILKDISGVFRPGRLCGVLGASGSGKTSLLSVLAGEAKAGELTGTVTVNGQEVYGKEMTKISGFVFQDDVILSTQRAREAIMMSALLRLPNTVSLEDKKKRAEDMIRLLNLSKCADTVVGDSMVKGISGGERKRVAMAMELVTNPAILFLDEPTSGLDTFTAYSVVSTLVNLAATGRTVVATIHQPSSEIFQKFDDLLILSEGEVIYHGPRDKVIEYFGARGFTCPKYTNPSDFIFMAILNNEEGNNTSKVYGETTDETNKKRLARLTEEWKHSQERADIQKILDTKSTRGIGKETIKVRSTFSTQFGYLFGRASKNAFRNPLIVRAKLAQTLLISLIIGLVYLNTDEKTGQPAIQNRAGVLFFLAVNNVFSTAIGMLSIFGQEKLVFAREFGAGYYTLPAYFFSKISVELPLQVIYPFLMSSIMYFMVGLQPYADKFFILSAFVILASLSGFAIGVFFAASFSSLPIALAATPLVLLPLMLFSGLFIQAESIPAYFSWIQWISPIKYAFDAMFKNEFSGLTLETDPSSRPQCPAVVVNGQVFPPPPIPNTISGDVIIKDYGLDNGLTIGLCAIILFCIVLVLMILAYFGLYRVVAAKSKTITIKKRKQQAAVAAGAASGVTEMEQVVAQK